ncbi:MAG: hypothetical protein IKX83_00080 [Clostridia bacterium]|nr:hypothetical protein [Clostridia bacterium]
MNKWYEEMLRQEAENEKLIRQVRKELRYAPKGELRRSRYRGTQRYYRTGARQDGKEEYLGKKKEALRDQLVQKKYHKQVLAALEQEQTIIETVKKKPWPTVMEVFETLPADLQEYVEPLILPDKVFVERWTKEMSKGASGEKLRSRIEIIYDEEYTQAKIPHVYEPDLYLEGFGSVRPDFAVLNVRTRQMFYHEHFGKMDDPDYRTRNVLKLRAYHKNGFFEGINLVVTMESDGLMVDLAEIREVIQTYFL